MQSKRKENKANFIKTIRNYPFLYDYNHPDYRNKEKSEAKWTQLAEEFGYDDATDARITWKNIITAYNKSKVHGTEPKKLYIFADEMKFMDGIRKNGAPVNFVHSIRETSTDHSIDDFLEKTGGFDNKLEDLNDKLEDSCEEPRAKRFKKPEEMDEKALIGLLTRTETPGKLFGRTIAIALDELSNRKRMEAQIEIQQVLLKYIE